MEKETLSVVTTRAKFEQMLADRCVFESQAKQIMELAIPKFKDTLEGYNVTWDRPASEYPEQFYNIGFQMCVKPSAIEWIDANLPQAWFRPIFAQ
jgi:hypothetical protein